MENYSRMHIPEGLKKLPQKIQEVLQQMMHAEHQEQLRKELLRINDQLLVGRVVHIFMTSHVFPITSGKEAI